MGCSLVDAMKCTTPASCERGCVYDRPTRRFLISCNKSHEFHVFDYASDLEYAQIIARGHTRHDCDGGHGCTILDTHTPGWKFTTPPMGKWWLFRKGIACRVATYGLKLAKLINRDAI